VCCALPDKVLGPRYPDPEKGRISEIFGSDIGSGYPRISNYSTTLLPYAPLH